MAVRAVVMAFDLALLGVEAAHRDGDPVGEAVAAPAGDLQNVAEPVTRLVLPLHADDAEHLRAPGQAVGAAGIGEARQEVPGSGADLHAVMGEHAARSCVDRAGGRADHRTEMQVVARPLRQAELGAEDRVANLRDRAYAVRYGRRHARRYGLRCVRLHALLRDRHGRRRSAASWSCRGSSTSA